MKSRIQKPLATISSPVTAKLYRGKFHAFESLKYLNFAALKAAKKAFIEIGSVEAAGVKVTVAAEIRNGLITEIRPLGCAECTKHWEKDKHSKATLKKLGQAAFEKTRGLDEPTVQLPMAVEELEGDDDGPIVIDIGPIVITIGEGVSDICISVDQPDGGWCLYCLFGGNACGGGKL
jgi:hypothetical protein